MSGDSEHHTRASDILDPETEGDDPRVQRFPHTLEQRGEKYDEIPTFPPRPSYKDYEVSLHRRSQVVAFDGAPHDPYHPASVPIYQTATFVQVSMLIRDATSQSSRDQIHQFHARSSLTLSVAHTQLSCIYGYVFCLDLVGWFGLRSQVHLFLGPTTTRGAGIPHEPL